MKAFYILLLIFFVSIGVAFGQDSTEVVDQVVVYKTNGDTFRYSYSYSGPEYWINSIVQKLKNGQWENQSRYFNYIDSNQFVLFNGGDVWYNGKWVPGSKYNKYYDSEWNLICIMDDSYEDGILIKSNKTSYTNNSKGLPLTTTVQYLKNEEYQNYSRTICSYDSDGNQIELQNEAWEDGKWVIKVRNKDTYDDRGNCLTHLTEEYANNQWHKINYGVGTYDERNIPLTCLSETWANDTLKEAQRTTMKYSLNDWVIDYIEEYYEDSEWFVSYKESKTVDDKGNLLTAYTENWEKGKLISTGQLKDDYNADEKMLTSLSGGWSEGKLQSAWRMTLSYNSGGQRLSYLEEQIKDSENIKNFDELMKTDAWDNYNKSTTEYDSFGRNICSVSEDWTNGQYIPKQRTATTYNDRGDTLTVFGERSSDGINWSSELTTNTYDQFGNKLSRKCESRNSSKELLVGSYDRSFAYNSNGKIINVTNKRFAEKEWRNYDFIFSFRDSKNRFSTWGYKAEVTYKTISPVKDEPNLSGFSLNCSPNPSAGPLNINYTITEPAVISISISNMMGIEVANISENQVQLPGTYNLNYDASNLAQGAYFITIKAGNKSETKKIIIND
ncbi:MAG: T9SS type A sorting domain-containing protein [bacterium]